jgi:tetratricopeptide (TPR) repeat protein
MGLLSALLATNQPLAISNVIEQQTGIAVPVPDPNDPTEKELRALMIEDDQAIAEVNDWINTNGIPQTNQIARLAFQERINSRLNDVKQDYGHFLRNHPDSARGYLAYGSFLNDIGDEEGAATEYENSRQLDPKNPAVWNNLANYYGEYGGVTNSFVDYAEAIRLDPTEPVYYQNFATTVYLFRKDAKDFYHINEQQTFDKALGLYRQAMKLDPNNLLLATDYAESYYGIKPLRTNDALLAWTNALIIAHNDNEREGVLIHLARVKISAGFYEAAQADLDAITNAAFADMKGRLERSLTEHKNRVNAPDDGDSTNAPASTPEPMSTSVVPGKTNAIPAATNPPPFSAKEAVMLPNVPPLSPKVTVVSSKELSAPLSLR